MKTPHCPRCNARAEQTENGPICPECGHRLHGEAQRAKLQQQQKTAREYFEEMRAAVDKAQ
jgi:predicted amidophosphoribosyltransferase